MRLGITTTLLAFVALLSPALSEAATFEVNVTNDDVDATIDGRCDTDASLAGRQCSLRGALAEANDRPNHDRIEFDPAVFNGTLGDEIDPVGGFLGVAEEVTIDAGDCGAGGFHKPCAAIDAPDGNSALVVGGDDVSIRGLAIHGAGIMSGGVRAFGADGLRVRNTWFGRRLNGTSSISGVGLSLEVSQLNPDNDSDRAAIGGRRARDANVFAGGSTGVLVAGGDRNQILGNLFGVDDLGTALAGMTAPIVIVPDTDIDEPAVGNVVGATLSTAAAASPDCDGGCNAITNGQTGVRLFKLGGTARKTTIAGNFIGLRPDGSSALENEIEGIAVAGSDGTTIGGSRRERNYITGGRQAWSQLGGSKALTVRGNLIGFDSTGQTPIDPPDGTGGGGDASLVVSKAQAPTKVTGNRYALAPSTTGLAVHGEGAVVTGNTFGLRRDGSGLPVPTSTRALRVDATRSRIGRPGAGNTIANLSRPGNGMIVIAGDENRIQGNSIGVDRGGDAHPNVGIGVSVQGDADDNLIGGVTKAAENVISNNSDGAIMVSALGESPAGNEIVRNRGATNGAEAVDLFVDLRGAFGFGNGDAALHGGIEAPAIDEASRTRVEGSDAAPGARVLIFRTGGPAGASPKGIKGFVGSDTANGAGNWSAVFDRIPAADNLTALQTDAADGSSELALVAAP